MKPMRFVEISGGPGERGAAHGRALSDPIGEFYDRWMRNAAESARPIREADAVAYALSLLPESRTQAPELVEEVEGIAEGAGVAFEKVWFLNCFDEAAGYHVYKGLNAGRACTTFAATGHSTTDGTTYVGQTWDIDEWYDSVLLSIAPSDGEIGVLTYTHPGVVGGSGINANGVALVWNSMHATDAHQGVPVPFLVRRALQAPKLSDAIPAVLGPVRAIGFNFILGADFGAVNVEASALRHHVTYIGRHLAHANHYAEPELLAIEANKTYQGSSFIRSGRMGQLLDQVAGHIDLETCQRLLRDHANAPASICAHPDLPKYCHHTQAALLYVPADRAMYITEGPPCQTEFVRHRVAVPTTAVS